MSPHPGPLSSELAALIHPPPRRVAVVGASPNPSRPSHEVASLLLHWGYEVFPVRPGLSTLFGRPAYDSLSQVPPVDIVDVFRRSEFVESHLPEILALRPQLLWLQDGVRDDRVAEEARRQGIVVVQDDCLARRIAELRAARAR